MLLKGLNKQVIVINDTGSEYFDSAIFFVSSKGSEKKAIDMVAEAERLVQTRLRVRETRSASFCGKTVAGIAAASSFLTLLGTLAVTGIIR